MVEPMSQAWVLCLNFTKPVAFRGHRGLRGTSSIFLWQIFNIGAWAMASQHGYGAGRERAPFFGLGDHFSSVKLTIWSVLINSHSSFYGVLASKIVETHLIKVLWKQCQLWSGQLKMDRANVTSVILFFASSIIFQEVFGLPRPGWDHRVI